MRVAIVSSPGSGSVPHWSHDAARALAAALSARGDAPTWFAVVRDGEAGAGGPAKSAAHTVAMPHARLSRVAADNRCFAIENELTRVLRAAPSTPVVHVGLGARGSPNLCWLADRLGSPAFAVVRAAEVVCHRGDLVDWRGAGCADFATPARCRRCCASGLRRAPANDFLARQDLLAASLLACRAVFVPSAADATTLEAFGVPGASVVDVGDMAALAARIAT